MIEAERSVAKIQRQANKVFRKGVRSRFSVEQVVEFGLLVFDGNRALIREPAHQLGEPPGEALALADALEAALIVASRPISYRSENGIIHTRTRTLYLKENCDRSATRTWL